MTTDIALNKQVQAGLIASMLGLPPNSDATANAAAVAAIAQNFCRVYKWNKAAADGAAGTATAATMMDALSFPGQVGLSSPGGGTPLIAAFIQTDATLTGDPSNNAAFTVQAVDATGANPVTIATLTTTVTLTKWVRTALTITSANVVLPVGGTLTVAIAKNGTGVVVPANTNIYVYVVDV